MLIVFAAGLPKIAKIAGDVKAYAERLFKFVAIGSLEKNAARMALEEPAMLRSFAVGGFGHERKKNQEARLKNHQLP